MIAMHEVHVLPIGDVHEAEWNANKVTKRTLDKIRRSLKQFGSVENQVVRPAWCVGAKTMDDIDFRRADHTGIPESWYECLSGNHRLQLYRESGVTKVQAAVVELPDPQAKMLAQALNRLGGKDDPDKLTALLKNVLETETPADVAALLPHTERDLLKLLNGQDENESPAVQPGPTDSQLGQVYELGPHRVFCGDSCDARAVGEMLAGAGPALTVTDPPYGVSLDQGWRDRVNSPGFREQSQDGQGWAGQSDRIAGDDGFDWTRALAVVKSDVIYLWYASRYALDVFAALSAHGYESKQQIIWRKPVQVVGRAHYHWQHEPCCYAIRTGVTPTWYGGRNQTTVWDAPSPRQIMGRRSDAEDKEDHPTQKPVRIFETPIVNHLSVGEVVYDPFLGSGTCLMAAAKTDRVCYGVELEPRYVDVIRRRWTKWARENGRDPGTGALD